MKTFKKVFNYLIDMVIIGEGIIIPSFIFYFKDDIGIIIGLLTLSTIVTLVGANYLYEDLEKFED